jgi:hypothetical protein
MRPSRRQSDPSPIKPNVQITEAEGRTTATTTLRERKKMSRDIESKSPSSDFRVSHPVNGVETSVRSSHSQPSSSQSKPIQISSDEEYNKLPTGTWILGTNGAFPA